MIPNRALDCLCVRRFLLATQQKHLALPTQRTELLAPREKQSITQHTFQFWRFRMSDIEGSQVRSSRTSRATTGRMRAEARFTGSPAVDGAALGVRLDLDLERLPSRISSIEYNHFTAFLSAYVHVRSHRCSSLLSGYLPTGKHDLPPLPAIRFIRRNFPH